MPARFAALFLLLVLHKSDNSLLSRFRNPNEFTVEVEPSMDEMDREMYDNLLEEMPQLRGHLRPRERPHLPYLKKNFDQSDEYDFMMNSADYDNSTFTDEISSEVDRARVWNESDFARFHSNGPLNATNSSDARRWNDWWKYWTGPKVATCYVCNIHTNNNIPISPACNDAFNSKDWRQVTLARYFRAHCYKNHWHWGDRFEKKWQYNRHHQTDRGLYRGYYGRYIGGCFKRFLDVGQVYTSRGCRSTPPRRGGGYADHRYRKLELLLQGKKNVCVMSSHASLTPFSRAISLYVRYHVCVCEGKFCNKATPMRFTFGLLFFITFIFIAYCSFLLIPFQTISDLVSR